MGRYREISTKTELVNLDQVVPRIRQKMRECMSVGLALQVNYNLEQSEKMISQYESFRFQNLSFLKKLVDDFEFRGDYPDSTRFVLKLLLDIQTAADLDRLSPKELYFLEYFLVNRYFKVLRNKVLLIIQQSGVFGAFLGAWGLTGGRGARGLRDSDFGWISHKRAIALWSDGRAQTPLNSQIFEDGFSVEICRLLRNNESQKLFEAFATRFYDLIQLLIVKFIVNRFGNTQLIFDEVECIEKDISELVLLVMDTWSAIRRDSADLRLGADSFATRLRELFPGEPRQIYLDLIKYIKFREMREYLERKKKSKFVRYRRNDEKIKKIYKHIMIHVYTDFKSARGGPLAPTPPLSQPELGKRRSLSGEDQSRQKVHTSDEKRRQSNPKTPLSLGTPRSPDLSLENLTPGRKTKRLFYQSYFQGTAEAEGLPIDHFYDPLKQTPANRKFKSFTNKYFLLLMKSDGFRRELQRLMQNHCLLFVVLKKYPKMLEDMMLANPTILVDQQKAKSKFLWTSYEFFFAMFFFKVKFKL